MLRKIIKIDEEKCNGCGACASACHEGAIEMIDGKAKLTREDYCDGLGDCLPACPTDAISFEVREAPAYDEAAVLASKNELASNEESSSASLPCGCPGTQSRTISRNASAHSGNPNRESVRSGHSHQKDGYRHREAEHYHEADYIESRLSQWPVQIKLVPINAPYFNGANLLVAADCSAYAYGDFHRDFIRNRITLIGCPKLDDVDYADKLTDIIANNDIKSVTVVRMQVPCCGGIENAVKRALQASGKMIPWQVVTISTDGQIIE